MSNTNRIERRKPKGAICEGTNKGSTGNSVAIIQIKTQKFISKGVIIIPRCNDELILAALVSTPSVRAAAEKCGVSERTIYKRFQDPAFKQRYDNERKAAFKRCSEALQARLTGAVETIGNVMDDSEASPQTRLNAAEAVLRHGLKFKEVLELADKLEELERKFHELEERGEEY